MDGDFPVSAVLIIASVHDSQVAIPLAQLSEQFVTSAAQFLFCKLIEHQTEGGFWFAMLR